MLRRKLLGSIAVSIASALAIKSYFAISVMAQKPITIEYWHINSESFGGPTVRQLVQEFERQNPDIKVIEQFQPNSYTGLLQNLQTRLAAKNPPDVAQIGYLFIDYVSENFPVKTIDELMQEYGGRDLLDAIQSNVLDLARRKGKLIGMPYSLSNIITYYNADILREAGLDPDKPPTTWSEWSKAARVIKEKTGKPGIYVQILDDNWSTQAMMESNGGTMIACKDGRIRATFDGPKNAEAIQMWADMIQEGLALNVLMNQGEQAFLAGEVATFMTTIAKRNNLEKNATFDLRGTTFPSFGSKPTRLPAGGNALVVFAQEPKRQEAAFRFIQFLSTPESFATWTKGTGYVPLHKDTPKVLGDFLTKNPIQEVAIRQMPNVVPWITFPGRDGLAAQQSLFTATQKVFSGQATAAKALRESVIQVNQLLENERCK